MSYKDLAKKITDALDGVETDEVLDTLEKMNDNHDDRGRFASAGGATSSSELAGDVSKTESLATEHGAHVIERRYSSFGREGGQTHVVAHFRTNSRAKEFQNAASAARNIASTQREVKFGSNGYSHTVVTVSLGWKPAAPRGDR